MHDIWGTHPLISMENYMLSPSKYVLLFSYTSSYHLALNTIRNAWVYWIVWC